MSFATVMIPDSHGAHIDPKAEAVFLRDLRRLRPQRIVMLGDHLDCGGTFSSHAKSFTSELTESYHDDVEAAARFLDAIQAAAPGAEIHYLEGNHEQRVQRWASSTCMNRKDAEYVLDRLAPEKVLRLKERGIRYYRTDTMYGGLTVPGTLRLGNLFATHGVSHSANAAAVHLARFGANVVFGHVHRVQSVINRTVTKEGFGAWSFGTLAKLQPLYRHTAPTNWAHGYGLMLSAKAGGLFTMLQVPIFAGKAESGLDGLLSMGDAVRTYKAAATKRAAKKGAKK